MNVLKTKTFWGAVIVAVAQVIQDHSPAAIAQAIGIVVAAAGARSAIAKNGAGK